MNKEEIQSIIDELYLLSKKAYEEGEVPVSAILVTSNNRYTGYNQVEKNNNPFQHAEFIVVNNYINDTKERYIKESSLFVSLEPCLFCMGAILKAGIKDLYYVLDDEKKGALSHYHIFVDDVLRVHRVEDNRFKELLQNFFIDKR